MTIGPGARFGAYEITGLIGAGGMGEVFRARDTTLGRDVAVKVLPQAFATDGDRLARLEREARTLASLNHPNIATIHGFEQAPAVAGQPAVRALVLELVEGQTLEELIDTHRSSNGGVPVGEALGLARQILAALEAAHEHGVVHRDLKPANVKVRPDGVVKVLDFGLAKLVEPGSGSASSAALSLSPTMTSPALMTGAGVILGTAAYMAPEQARGRAVDKRADIWAFGCVLYEMLTRRRPFDGEDVAAVLAGVIKSDPDWTLLPSEVPASVRTVLERCLQKDPQQRLRDVGDVRLALDGVLTTREVTEVRVEVPAAAPTVLRAPWWRRTPAVAAAALTIGAAAAGATAWQLRTPEAPRVTRLTIAHDGPEAIAPTNTSNVTITPDGRRVVYLAGQPLQGSRMFMRSLDSLASTLVATGDGNVFDLSMSPDGQWVGFGAPGAMLKKVSLDSGTIVTVVERPNAGAGNLRGAAWTPDGRVVLGGNPADGLRAYAASGGSEFEQITKPDNEFHQRPALLPGGRALLFTSVPTGQPTEGKVSIADLSSGAIKKLFPGGMPVYVPTGHIVYAFEGSLRAVVFDAETLQVRGSPVTVADGVATTLSGSGNFAVSANGTLVYVAGRPGGGARRLVWVDRAGKEEPLAAPERAYAYARFSPDGTRIALDVRDQQNDIWVWDVTRQTLTRLTFDPGLNRSPVWTPDGRRIAYSVARDDGEAAFWKSADGSGAPEELQTGEEKYVSPMAFTPDGATFLFASPLQTPFNIWRASVTGDRKAEHVLDAEFSETNAEVSYDGRWMAYQSDESGRPEVYVRPWPDVNAGRWQVSTGGGTRPLWSRDGRELFYFVQGSVMSVPLRAGATFSAGTPAAVIKGDYIAPQAGRQYDVTADGKRFLMIKDAASDGGAQTRNQIVVVQNWFDELKRLVPVD